MAMSIGCNPFGGIYSEADAKRGKIASAGTRASTNVNGDTREYVAVKLASGTIVNGTLLTLDSTGAAGIAVTASGNPAPLYNSRVGVLCFASATATQTIAATGVAWAQVWGVAKALVSATASAVGLALAAKANGHLAQLSVGLSASAMLEGISCLTTQSGTAVTLIAVMLNYPAFSGPPDTNLA